MPGNLAKLIKPTGYENLLQAMAEKRKLAEQLDQNLGDTSPVGSWTQVLAKIMQGFVAARENRTADKLEEDYNTKLTNAFGANHAAFLKDVADGMSPKDLVAKWSGNQFEESDLKPYADAYGAGLKEDQTYTNFNGRRVTNKEAAGLGYDPGSPNDAVQRDPITGKPVINYAKVAASMASQLVPQDANSAAQILANPSIIANPTGAPVLAPGNFDPTHIGQVESGNRDFINGQPVTSPKGAMYGMQVLPSTAARPGFGVQPVPPEIMALPITDPRRAAAFDRVGNDYAAAMRARYGNNPVAASAAYNAGPGAVDRSIASNGANFLSGLPGETQRYARNFRGTQKPPDGMTTDGRPYWLINGQAYDNPDGN